MLMEGGGCCVKICELEGAGKRKGELDNNASLPPNNLQAPTQSSRLTCSVKLKAAFCKIFNASIPRDIGSNFDSTDTI